MTLATTWTNSEKHVTSLDSLMPIIRQQLSEGKCVRFTPTGNSMLPLLRHNEDNVTLSPVKSKLKMYDIALYQRDNGDYVLHRVVGVSDRYTLLGDNQFIKEYGIEHSQIIGVVSSFNRNGCEHSVDELGYKIYCRLWYHSRRFRHLWRRVKGKLRRMFK